MLASGGLDSSVLLADMARKGRSVFPIYIRAGLRWELNEIAVLRRFISALAKPNIEAIAMLDFPTADVVRDHWTITGKGVPGYHAALASNYIPGRNLSLLSKAVIFCARNRIGEIGMATLHSNPFPDARPEFFRAFEKAVKIGMDLPLRALTPFARLDKADVIRKGRGLPLQLTLSCARPRGVIHCGACTKCAERIEGFRDAGVADPTRYARR
ncbi:MAG TPA: 7-cyano-7-deazaguanine synthase [Candidatus Binataceae bacterium]|nr:7-cyano-7-deazaguanine synthase [Candidatus Binataceae bacterium]